MGYGTEYIKFFNGSAGKYTRVGGVNLIKKSVVKDERPQVKALISNAAAANGAALFVINGLTFDADKTVYAMAAVYRDNQLVAVKTTYVTIAA